MFVPFTTAVSLAVCQYLSTSSIVTSSNVVIGPGVGTFTGVISGCIPESMTLLMMSQAASVGIMGLYTQPFFNAISFGVCNTIMTSGLAQGAVIGGGPGAGVGTLSGLIPEALTGLIMSQLAAVAIFGSHTLQLVTAISYGICIYLMTSVVITTACIGSVMPPPAGPVPIPCAVGIGSLI
jgi:hypothetical protein